MLDDLVYTGLRRFPNLRAGEPKNGPPFFGEVFVFALVTHLGFWKRMPVNPISLYCKALIWKCKINDPSANTILKFITKTPSIHFFYHQFFNRCRSLILSSALMRTESSPVNMSWEYLVCLSAVCTGNSYFWHRVRLFAPQINATFTAKSPSSRIKPLLRNTHRLATSLASCLYTWLTLGSEFARIIPALWRAIFQMLLRGWPLESLSARLANKYYLISRAYLPAFVTAIFGCLCFKRTKFIEGPTSMTGQYDPFVLFTGVVALLATILSPVSIAWLDFKRFATGPTHNCNRHNKTLLTQGSDIFKRMGKAQCQWLDFSKWLIRPFLSHLDYNIRPCFP